MDYINEALNAVAARARQNAKPRPDDYLKDGLIHCGACHTPRQFVLTIPTMERGMIVPCLCACDEEQQRKMEIAKKELRQMDRQAKAAVRCFGDNAATMAKKTFETVDPAVNPKQTAMCRRYAEDFDFMHKNGRGLLLHGDIGNGKTHLAACIANALMAKGREARFLSLPEMALLTIDQRRAVLEELRTVELAIVDDFGAQRRSEFMDEIAFEVMDTRSRTNLPLVITSNFTAEEIKNASDRAMARILDRVLERTHPILFDGQSLRRAAMRRDFEDMEARLKGART